MEDWVHRALARWPNVPALYGWLSLDRRGRWRIRGELISRPQILDTLNANYAADERGCWYFQNGPQRGYVELAYAPLVLQVKDDGQTLRTHTAQAVTRIEAASLDEEGSLLLLTEHGPGLLADTELEWALARLKGADGQPIDESRLMQALALPTGADTGLSLQGAAGAVPVQRLDAAQVPGRHGFVRQPQAADDRPRDNPRE